MATLLSKSYDIVSGKEVDSDVPEQPAVDTSGTVEITGNIVEKAGNSVYESVLSAVWKFCSYPNCR